jgi:5-formyltetrahydrofolate cyclo-ligase
VQGAYGILEPKMEKDREVDPAQLDIIIVPGVAFDRKGFRIGFGKGFYDRFLETYRDSLGRESKQSFCIGLAFEMQIVDSLPRDAYDEKVDLVITEDNIYGKL